MATVLDDVYESVARELECPICTEFMIPPITLCESGHIICKECRPQLNYCPTCRQKLLPVRCVPMENIARHFDYPCIYRKFGCPERFRLEEIQGHQVLCSYSPTTCPYSNVRGIMCTWKGVRGDVKSHLLNSHELDAESHDGRHTITIEDFSPITKYFKVIFAHDEVFYRRVEVKDGVWHCIIFYVGQKENASKFRYKISFSRENGTENIAVCHITQCLGVEVSDIYKNCRCVKLPLDVIKCFLDEQNNLKYEMELLQSNKVEKLVLEA